MLRNIANYFPRRSSNTNTSANNSDMATQTDDRSTQGTSSIPDRLLDSADQASAAASTGTPASAPDVSLKDAEKIMESNHYDFVFRKELKLSTLKADPPIGDNQRVVSVKADSESQSTVVTASKYNKDEKTTHTVSEEAKWLKEFLDAHKAYANKFDIGHKRMANEILKKNERPQEVFLNTKSDLGKLAENKVIATFKPEKQLKILTGQIGHFPEEIQNEIRNNAKKYQDLLDTYRKSVGKVFDDCVSKHDELQGLMNDGKRPAIPS